LAIGRKAFGRAFRTQGMFDLDAVRDLIAQNQQKNPGS